MARPHPSELLDFSGRTVLVTGAGRGIGAGVARRFALAGAGVAVHHRTSGAEAAVIVEEIEREGGRGVLVQANLTRGQEVSRLMAEVVDRLGRLDVLINNAGIYPQVSLEEMQEEEWDETLEANLKSVFLCTQAASRQMIARGDGGSIVNVASIEGERPAPLHSHYNAAKAAVLMHTRAAAFELASRKVRVNAVSPGLIWRQGIEESWPDGVKRWQARAPLERLGLPEDVADACLFLSSPAASWITGVNLPVDGGVLATPAF